MKNVGDAQKRNLEFLQKFSRERLIAQSVRVDNPVLFDIGAHNGESVIYLRSIFPKSVIYSFEPDPESFEILKNRGYDNNFCFNVAISNECGKVAFFRNEISHTNSLFKVNLDSKDSIRINEERINKSTSYFERINKQVTVDAIRLDDFVEQHHIESIDLLKIDVQGVELKVLDGGAGALQKTNAIILEASFYDFYESRSSFYDIERILLPAGFRMFSIMELSQNPMNGRTDWAEILYTR